MRAVGTNVWSRVPGYESDDSDQEGGEREDAKFRFHTEERLSQITSVLGQRWIVKPLLKFVPAAPRSFAKDPASLRLRKSVQQLAAPMNTNGLNPYFVVHADAPLVRDTFQASGLFPHDRDWQIHWSGPNLKEQFFQSLHEFQHVNHFPGGYEITRKDRLWANFSQMASMFGTSAFDFVPETYVLPQQADQFLEHYQRTDHIWIVKPNASSRGRGIFLLRDLGDLPIEDLSVVCRYVDNPLLIQGLKFDLRIYVLVTSFDPLVAYVYREGLTRFASRPYSTAEEHLQDAFRHLTNYSINKDAKNFVENKQVEADNVGHKWSLSALNKHLKCVGLDVELMWSRIDDLIMKTLLSAEPTISAKTRELTQGRNCFEIYGFDVLVDDKLKPWLLEVNLSPSMQADSPLDFQIKSQLLTDAFNLVGVHELDRNTINVARMRAAMNMDEFRRQGRRHQAKKAGGFTKANAPPAPGTGPKSMPTNLKNIKAYDRERPVNLDQLSESQLKMLAKVLEEQKRCGRNFIPLHPTKASVERYACITEARSLRPRDESAVSKSSRLSSAQLIASVLFGPRPVRGGPGAGDKDKHRKSVHSKSGRPSITKSPRLQSPKGIAGMSETDRNVAFHCRPPSAMESRSQSKESVAGKSLPSSPGSDDEEENDETATNTTANAMALLSLKKDNADYSEVQNDQPSKQESESSDESEAGDDLGEQDGGDDEVAGPHGGIDSAMESARDREAEDGDKARSLASTGFTNASDAAVSNASSDEENTNTDDESSLDSSPRRGNGYSREASPISQESADRQVALSKVDGAVQALGQRVGGRLLVMEYLRRLTEHCDALGAADRAKLAQSASYARLAKFQRQLVASVDGTKPDASEVVDPDADDAIDGRSLVDDLADSCRQGMASLRRSAYFDEASPANASSSSPPSEDQEDDSPTKRIQLALARREKTRRALEGLPLLAAADLESILRSSSASTSFQALLESFNDKGENHGAESCDLASISRDHHQAEPSPPRSSLVGAGRPPPPVLASVGGGGQRGGPLSLLMTAHRSPQTDQLDLPVEEQRELSAGSSSVLFGYGDIPERPRQAPQSATEKTSNMLLRSVQRYAGNRHEQPPRLPHTRSAPLLPELNRPDQARPRTSDQMPARPRTSDQMPESMNLRRRSHNAFQLQADQAEDFLASPLPGLRRPSKGKGFSGPSTLGWLTPVGPVLTPVGPRASTAGKPATEVLTSVGQGSLPKPSTAMERADVKRWSGESRGDGASLPPWPASSFLPLPCLPFFNKDVEF